MKPKNSNDLLLRYFGVYFIKRVFRKGKKKKRKKKKEEKKRL